MCIGVTIAKSLSGVIDYKLIAGVTYWKQNRELMSSYRGKYADELIATTTYIRTLEKGILAADESTGTIGKRLLSINDGNVETNRTALRELLFCTPGCLQFLSGVILFEETLC